MKSKGNVLITGAYGFLGMHIARVFSQNGYSVFGLGYCQDRSITDMAYFSKNFFGAVSEKNLSNTNTNYSAIIHCAGASSVSFVENNAIEAANTTIDVTQEILNYIKTFSPTTKLVYISSAAVYGDTGEKPICESAILNPVSLYGYHKKICEDLCEYYKKKYDLQIKIVRPFSVCGKNLRKQLIWDACNKFSNGINTFWGIGNECRDWIDVEDVANLILSICETDTQSYVFNASNGLAVQNQVLLSYLASFFSDDVHLEFNGEINIFDPKNLVGSTVRVNNELNFMPKKQWKRIIDDYVFWFKKLQE